MADSDHVRQFVELGLTQYEAKAYLGLVRRDSMTAAEVSRVAGVPRQRIYDVLQGLVQRGLASVRPGEPVRYAAAPPSTAVDRLVADHRSRLDAIQSQGARMVEELGPAFHEGRAQTNPLDYIEVLRDPRAVGARFEELLGSVREEILVFTRPPFAVTAQDNLVGLDVATRYLMRTIYEISSLRDPTFRRAVDRFVEAGEVVRFAHELPMKLGVIDETIVMFGMDDPVAGSGSVTTAVIEHPALARFLKLGFEAVWKTALTYDEADAVLDGRGGEPDT